MERLSQDVAYLIFHRYCNHKSTLFQLSLVSKGFSALSRPLLFRHVVVGASNPDGLEHFYGFLRGATRLAESIHHLNIRGCGLEISMIIYPLRMTKLPCVLGLLGSLQTLRIYELFLDFQSLCTECPIHQHISPLRQLKLKTIADTQPHNLMLGVDRPHSDRRPDYKLSVDHLFSLFTFFPSLRDLEVSEISFRNLQDPLDQKLVPLRLSRFEVACCNNPDLLLPAISTSTLESLYLSPLDKSGATIIRHLRGINSLCFRPRLGGRAPLEMIHASSLSACLALSSFIVNINSFWVTSTAAQQQAWDAISMPIPFLSGSLTSFRIQIHIPCIMDGKTPNSIFGFNQRSDEEWHKIQSGLLALGNLQSVEVMMDFHDYYDPRHGGPAAPLKHFGEAYLQLQEVLENKLPILKKRGLFVWMSTYRGGLRDGDPLHHEIQGTTSTCDYFLSHLIT